MSEIFAVYFMCVLSGVIGQFSSEPELRKAGIILAACGLAAGLLHVGCAYVRDLIDRSHSRKYYGESLRERVNDLEVWREETEPETQFLKDRIVNFEAIKGGKMEVYKGVSYGPLLLAGLLGLVYYVFLAIKKERNE